MKKIISILLCISVIFSFASINITAIENSEVDTAVNQQIDVPYDYPIKAGTQEWFELKTIHDKIKACQIPEDILSSMTTEALIETIRNYPLAVNIYAYDSIELGYEKVKSQFNGIVELEKRLNDDRSSTMVVLEKYASAVVTKSVDVEFEDCFIDTIKGCIERANGTESSFNEKTVYDTRATNTYVYTPEGSAIVAYSGLTWNDQYIASGGQITEAKSELAHEKVQETFSSVTYVDGYDIDPSFNCHSYAWYSTSSSNNYWINDPSDYILDGSYVEASYYHVGAKILYGTPGNEPEHSAIVDAVSDYHLTYVTSKWGCLGVYRHLYYDSPYASGINKYHRV